MFTIDINVYDSLEKPSIFLYDSFFENKCFGIVTPSNISLEELLSEENISKMISNCLDEQMSFKEDLIEFQDTELFKEAQDRYEEMERAAKEIKDSFEKGLDFIKNNKIMFRGSSEFAVSYLNKQKLDGITPIIDCDFRMDQDSLQIAEKFYKINPNILFNVYGNDSNIDFIQYKNTVERISEIVDKVKSQDLSPFEQALYAYDLVRDRVYIKEEKDESKTVSRDVTSSLLGNKIVCSGFAKIYETVLKNLGFDCGTYSLARLNLHGHMRSIAHIKDEKYNIDGLYFFDPTWDCKKNEDDNSYLDSYKYFAKTLREFDPFDRRYVHNTLYGITKESIDGIIKKLEAKDYNNITIDEYLSIKNISNIFDEKGVMPYEYKEGDMENRFMALFMNYNKEKVLNKLKYYRKILFESKIDISKYVEAIIKVRYIESKENKEKYKFDKESFEAIIYNSYISKDDPFLNLFCAINGLSDPLDVSLDESGVSTRSAYQRILVNMGIDPDSFERK